MVKIFPCIRINKQMFSYLHQNGHNYFKLGHTWYSKLWIYFPYPVYGKFTHHSLRFLLNTNHLMVKSRKTIYDMRQYLSYPFQNYFNEVRYYKQLV